MQNTAPYKFDRIPNNDVSREERHWSKSTFLVSPERRQSKSKMSGVDAVDGSSTDIATSVNGTKRTSAPWVSTSAFGGITDIKIVVRDFRY